ncbi:flagellar hook-basal body complex protein [Pelagibacteraceae bacterium]|nr:flagellar hook-basal body complex protein [Pelagibacteraceae bacterium]
MSFYTALTGLNGSQADISATSNNIANVATTGYKRSRAEFGDIFATSPLQNSSSSIGSGTILKGIKQQFTQGNIASSLNALDLAISGQGFFALKPSATSNQTVFTRNGAFSVNNDRFIVDSSGQFVLALPVSADGSVEGSTIDDAKALKLALESGEAKATENMNLSVNLNSSSQVFENYDDSTFKQDDPSTYTASTSITIFDNLGKPVIATVYFIKTQVASGDNNTHKYQTKFVVDGNVIEPALSEALDSTSGESLYIDRFGQLVKESDVPKIAVKSISSPLYYLDDLSTPLASSSASVTGTSVEGAFEEVGDTITIVTDPLKYNSTYDASTDNTKTFWGKDFLTVRVDDEGGDKAFTSVDIRPGTYTAETLASEVQRAVNNALSDDKKISLDPVKDGSFSIKFNQINADDEVVALNAISVNLLTDSFVTSDIFTSGISNEATPNLSRDEFLAHAQLRVNESLNRAAVSADESSGSASTLGVSTKLFARTIGSAISTIHNNTEVFDFEYYKNSADPTTVDSTNALNKKHLTYSYYNASPELKVFDNKINVGANAAGYTVVNDSSGLKVYLQGSDASSLDTSDSTTWPSKVTLAGRFTDTAGTNNASFGETKLDGREFTVSSVAADSDGHKYLLLSTTDTDTVNISDTDVQVLHTASTDVEAFFEGGASVFDGSTSHFGSNKIVLRETFKHSYKNTDVINESRGWKGGAVAATTSSTAISTNNTVGIALDGGSATTVTLAIASGLTNTGVAADMETDINAALTGSDAVTVEWTGTEYRIMSNTGTSSGAIALTSIGSGLAALNLGGTNATSSWVGNDTSTLANTTGKKFTIAAANDSISVTINNNAYTGTIANATYTDNAALGEAIEVAVETAIAAGSSTGDNIDVVWTGEAYAITSSTGAAVVTAVDAGLDSHVKLSTNYGAAASSGGAASTGYGGIFSNFKSSLSAGDLNSIGLNTTASTYSASTMGTTTTDWVNEKKPPVKIAYDVENQKFTFEGDGSIIGPSQSSKFFSFSVFGPSTTTNSLGLKSSANAPTSLVGGGEKLNSEAIIFKGTNVSTNQAYGVTVSYNSNLNKFTINSATTGEKILADGAVGVSETTTASNIEIGRLAISAGVATASETGIGGSNALFGLGTTTTVASTASGTAKGLASQPAVLNGKTSNEDLSKEFFLSGTSQENVFLMNVDGISSPVVVPEGTYTGTTLAAALQLRINQMESTTGKTVNGVKVGYDLVDNRLTFTTGTTGPKSQMFVSGAARLGLDDLDVASGSTPIIYDLPSAAAQIDGKNAYVNSDTEIVTVAPEDMFDPADATVKAYTRVFLKPGELTFDTKGTLVSPTQNVEYKGDFPANIATGKDALSIDLDLSFADSSQLASPFSVTSVSQDGQTVGRLDGLDIDASGLVRANYTNGDNVALGRLVISNFNNQNGLKQIGNATYVETSVSGTAIVGEAGADGFGTILSGSLERSNVDITEELVSLITAQRNFQANAKSIETNSTITQAIINIRN